jgi:hypothetical protein
VSTLFHGNGIEVNGPYQSSVFAELAGDNEDWHRLIEFDREQRWSTLVHFICRFLYHRMTTDGEISTSLLPVDMLSTYRRMLDEMPAFYYRQRSQGRL